MNQFFQKLRFLLQRRRKKAELREELQFHFEEEAEQLEAEGLSGDEARHPAHLDLGNISLLQEETRAA